MAERQLLCMPVGCSARLKRATASKERAADCCDILSALPLISLRMPLYSKDRAWISHLATQLQEPGEPASKMARTYA